MDQAFAKDIARWGALGALFLIPLTPLIVADTLFFPFITGKAYYFRILAEVLFASWAVLALMDKAYRPRFSWVGVVVFAFVVWMFVADLFAINVEKAFWSNFERMEGWVLLVHLGGFFVAASATLRATGLWRRWLLWGVIASIAVVCYALFQSFGWSAIHQGSSRIDASLGNSAYLAIYLLFNAFIAGWLALTEKNTAVKWLLAGLALLEGILVLLTETRGTVLGLIGALLLCAFLFAVTEGGRVRRYAVAALVVLLVLVGGLFTIRESAFVQKSEVLHRITSISFADLQTRFTIWGMAFKGFEERPITGWGQEGFNYVFNKYYDPSLFAQEPWFDRAHNAFIDWLMAGGLPAFLLYLALFGTSLWMLWRSPLSRVERIVLTGAFVGYAIHNLVVFDNIYSYVYFFALLAFVDSLTSRPITFLERQPEVKSDGGVVLAVPAAIAILIVLIWLVNLRGIGAASRLVAAITPQADLTKNIALLTAVAAHPSFAAQEEREQMASFALTASQSSIPDTTKKQFAELAVAEMKKQVEEYPQDAREHLELSLAYRAAGDLQNSLAEIEAARQLSPNKEQILIQEGAAFWDAGDAADAAKAWNEAYRLGPQFPELAVYAAAGDYLTGNPTKGRDILMDAYGTTTVDSDALALAYYNTKDYPDLIALWELRARQPNASAQTYLGLAGAYYAAGERQKAIDVLTFIAAHDPSMAADVEAAIKQIQSGK